MKNKGFTLIETFGAITILILAVMGPLTLLSNNISDGAIIKNQTVAGYLAQEAIEMAIHERDSERNVGAKDTSLLNGWLGVLANNSCFSGDGCYIDLNDVGEIVAGSCSGKNPLCEIDFDTSAKFTRHIIVEPFDTVADFKVGGQDGPVYFWATEGAKITVVITWDFKGRPKKFMSSAVLYNDVVEAKGSEVGSCDLDPTLPQCP